MIVYVHAMLCMLLSGLWLAAVAGAWACCARVGDAVATRCWWLLGRTRPYYVSPLPSLYSANMHGCRVRWDLVRDIANAARQGWWGHGCAAVP